MGLGTFRGHCEGKSVFGLLGGVLTGWTLIASGDRTGAIVVREVASEKIVQTISVSRLYSDFNRLPDGSARVGEYELGGVRSLIFTPDGKTLIAGGMDQYDPTSAGIDGKMGLFGFEPTTGKPIFELTLSRGKGYLQAMLIHPSGALIAAGGGGVSGSGKGAFCVVDLANPRDAAIYEVEMTIRARSGFGQQAPHHRRLDENRRGWPSRDRDLGTADK